MFGTRNQWNDHRCRQLILAVLDEGVTYCGCRLTPDDFCQPKEISPFPATKLVLAVAELAGGKKMDRWGLPKEWKWDYYLEKWGQTTQCITRIVQQQRWRLWT